MKRPHDSADLQDASTTKSAKVAYDQEQTHQLMVCLQPLCDHVGMLPHEFEKHYWEIHANQCQECFRSFPSAHLLSLHISENHDPFVDILAEPFACFEVTCSSTFHNRESRIGHLQQNHGYPPAFDYDVVDIGIVQDSNTQAS